MKNINIYENAIRALLYLYKKKSNSDLETEIINHWCNSLPNSVHSILAKLGRLLRNDEFEIAWILAKQSKDNYYSNDRFKICYHIITYMCGSLKERTESSEVILNWDRKLLSVESVKLFDKIKELISVEL